MKPYQGCYTLKDTNQPRDLVTWLNNLEKFGMHLGLERVSALLDALGNPHTTYRCIHVAGTNGKGTVTHLIGNILQQDGYRTGVYTSPHLQQFSERITINNIPITPHALTTTLQMIKKVMETRDIPATYFEVVTALAFKYFQESSIDAAVVETGLGGRLDATNVVDPVVSIITNISLEHTDILGNTLTAIAREKAGIIKNAPVVTAARGRALTTLQRVAAEKKVPFLVIGKDIQWRETAPQCFRVQGKKTYNLTTQMIGSHQGENIALAVAASETLGLSPQAIQQGVTMTALPGRTEVFRLNPLILLDGAHNPGAMKQLKKTLLSSFQFKKLIFVLGILADKDIPHILSLIAPLGDYFIITESSNPRACRTDILAAMVRDITKKEGEVISEKNMKKALRKALMLATENDLICITGSLFTAGEARTILTNIFK